MAIPFVLILVLGIGSLAVAQNQPGQAAAEKREPLFFVKIAADVASNVQDQPLNQVLGLYVNPQAWESATKDSDLGPFFKLKEPKADRSGACVLSQEKTVAVCVFFDGETPFGVVSVKAAASGKIEPGDVSAGYKAITKEMLKKSKQELHFEPGGVNTDDGVALPGFLITTVFKPIA